MSDVVMACERCRATIRGTVAEAIAWSEAHDDYCPALAAQPDEETDA